MTGFVLPPRTPLPRVRWYHDETQKDAVAATIAPRMPWDKFKRDLFRPRPGEHVTIIGSTGRGKSHLMNEILPLYPYVVVFGTKKTDTTMDRLVQQGYHVYQRWASLPATQYPRRIIWPREGGIKDMARKQHDVFEDAFDHIYAEGGRPTHAPVGWCIGIDEIYWFSNTLKLDAYLKIILQHARSMGITLVGATQRPAWIPTEFYSMPTHLFFFKTTDENNLQRIGDLQAGNKQIIRTLVSELEQYQVLYINNITGRMARTRTPAPRD